MQLDVVKALLKRKAKLLGDRERIAALISSTSRGGPPKKTPFRRKLTPLQLKVRQPKLQPLK